MVIKDDPGNQLERQIETPQDHHHEGIHALVVHSNKMNKRFQWMLVYHKGYLSLITRGLFVILIDKSYHNIRRTEGMRSAQAVQISP